MATASSGVVAMAPLIPTCLIHHHVSSSSPSPVILPKKRSATVIGGVRTVRCCRLDSAVGKRRAEKSEEFRLDLNSIPRRLWNQALPSAPFVSCPPSQSRYLSKHYSRCTPRSIGPQSHDTPPQRDTGIANEKDWGITLLVENVNETGTNEDGSTWYRESGENFGENGYRCRWTRMGGCSHDDLCEWKETWWEKSDWTGYKELGIQYQIASF